MVRATAGVTLLLATVALSGCMTYASVCLDDHGDGGKLPYGGATRCVGAMKHTLLDDNFIAIPNSRPLCLAFQVCDLPLSLAADTLLLPFTVTYTVARSLQAFDDRVTSREEQEPFSELLPREQVLNSREQK